MSRELPLLLWLFTTRNAAPVCSIHGLIRLANAVCQCHRDRSLGISGQVRFIAGQSTGIPADHCYEKVVRGDLPVVDLIQVGF